MINILFALLQVQALKIQTVQGNSINKDGETCLLCPGSDIVWMIDDNCYCGTAAKNITECVKTKKPTWPERDKEIKRQECGSPIHNKDYLDCFRANMEKSQQKDDSNAIVLQCVESLPPVLAVDHPEL
ncbi:hypothetical protein HDV01_006386 [Terramyces sp. JEL0728]|nr:hypothetical protein HDV01_006386 [Terramyces sp. JEL0728]